MSLSDYFYIEGGDLKWKLRSRGLFSSDRSYNLHKSRYANKKAGHEAANGYVQVRVSGRLHYAHRIIWELINGPIPHGYEIDHMDNNPSNNKIENLRVATSSSNKHNTRKPSHNSSGFKGVSLHKASGRYAAYIKNKGKKIHIGYFSTPNEAHDAYKAESDRLFGEFARYE